MYQQVLSTVAEYTISSTIVLAKMWAGALLTSTVFYVLMSWTPLQTMGRQLVTKILPEKAKYQEVKRGEPGDVTLGRAYNLCTLPDDNKAWFTFSDVLHRYLLVQLAFVWTLLTNPLSFPVYTFKYNWLWYGYIYGTILSLFYPITPVAYTVVELFRKVNSLFVNDWMMEGPGRVFFVKPDGCITAFLWDMYLTQSMFIGQYFLVGTHDDAIQHTWYDTILTKDFWRQTLSNVDARVPRQLAYWDGEKLTVNFENEIEKTDLVIKINDSFLGIGDSFWDHGKDFKTEEELILKLKENYNGKVAHVLELVRPKKSLGVHSMDVLTMRTPDGDVKVFSALLWTDCTTNSSHSCRAGYVLDVNTEKVVSAASWYSPAFITMDKPLIGQKFPGVKAACESAVAAHKNIEHQWLTVVGWDMMVMENDIVFFEGNFAGARTPRRLFLSISNFVEFIGNYFWPFGKGHSITPSQPLIGTITI